MLPTNWIAERAARSAVLANRRVRQRAPRASSVRSFCCGRPHKFGWLRSLANSQKLKKIWLRWEMMDIEPDRLSGSRTTATVIGRFLIAAFLLVETALVQFYFWDWIITSFLAIGALWFLTDATLLWKERAYSPREMRLFLWGRNAAALLGMVWDWTYGTLTHVVSTAGLLP